MGTLMTSNEVTLLNAYKEANLRIFFMCFLKVHLATHFYMDGYLGFIPPKPMRSLLRASKPQIAVHPLRSV